MVAVQRVVKASDHAGGVAKSGMDGDIAHALAIDPHLAAIIETVEKFLAGVGKPVGHSCSPRMGAARGWAHRMFFGDARGAPRPGQRAPRRRARTIPSSAAG